MNSIERRWESFAGLESSYEKALANPEHRALSADAELVLESQQSELYVPLA